MDSKQEIRALKKGANMINLNTKPFEAWIAKMHAKSHPRSKLRGDTCQTMSYSWMFMWTIVVYVMTAICLPLSIGGALYMTFTRSWYLALIYLMIVPASVYYIDYEHVYTDGCDWDVDYVCFPCSALILSIKIMIVVVILHIVYMIVRKVMAQAK